MVNRRPIKSVHFPRPAAHLPVTAPPCKPVFLLSLPISLFSHLSLHNSSFNLYLLVINLYTDSTRTTHTHLVPCDASTFGFSRERCTVGAAYKSLHIFACRLL